MIFRREEREDTLEIQCTQKELDKFSKFVISGTIRSSNFADGEIIRRNKYKIDSDVMFGFGKFSENISGKEQSDIIHSCEYFRFVVIEKKDKEVFAAISKEEFLDTAIGLLQIYVENDHGDCISEILKEELAVDERDIPSILYTIRNWRFNNET